MATIGSMLLRSHTVASQSLQMPGQRRIRMGAVHVQETYRLGNSFSEQVSSSTSPSIAAICQLSGVSACIVGGASLSVRAASMPCTIASIIPREGFGCSERRQSGSNMETTSVTAVLSSTSSVSS